MTFTIEKTVVYPDKVHTVRQDALRQQTSVVAGDEGWADGPMGAKDLEGDDLAEAKEELQHGHGGHAAATWTSLDLPGPGAPRGRRRAVPPGLRHRRR